LSARRQGRSPRGKEVLVLVKEVLVLVVTARSVVEEMRGFC
jgi:hypothetical protein